MSSTRFDLDDDDVLVIIGSGAGGGTLAYELTKAGRKVVLLEAGAHWTNDDFVNDEYSAAGQLLWAEPRTSSGSTFVSTRFPRTPALMGKAVGGSTAVWTGLTPRFKAHEFAPLTTYGHQPGAELVDWPFGLEKLLPYYERAERTMGVSHRHGRKPMPANNNYKVFSNAARSVGYRHYATGPYATNVEPFDGRPGTIQDGFNIQGDRNRSKWSTLVREVPLAESSGRLDLRPQCRAVEITQRLDGLVDGVVYLDPEGNRVRQRAAAVALAGNAIETPRLLLMSNARAPEGLANSSGAVGRFYTRHVTGYVFGHFDQPVHMYRGENMAGILADESRHDPSRGFVGGYYLELFSVAPLNYAAILEPTAWGADYTAKVEAFDRTAALWICGEDLPRVGNRVTLDEHVRDAFGYPVPHVHTDEHPNDTAIRAHAMRQGRAMYEAVGASEVTEAPGMPSGHNMGTARMSGDSETGVVDKYGRAHDVPNLFVSDGSVFPSSAAANPTLTLVAFVLRQAEHIVRSGVSDNESR